MLAGPEANRPMTPPGGNADPHDILDIDGVALARMIAGGAAALHAQRRALDAINVFPVPDGDTGANMSATMREAAGATPGGTPHVAAVAKAVARASLMSAKGNSGVILSQILTGLADLRDDAPPLDGPALAAAFARARDAAYRALSKPCEGTMLTAIASAAEAARRVADGGATAGETLAAAADGARDAVARTPELLPVLKEAGVVDAGAQGLSVLLDGMLRALRGEAQPAAEAGFGAINAEWLRARESAHAAGAQAGFCTEFVIEGVALDGDTVRARLEQIGGSVLVVGDGGVLHAHLHTLEPDVALAYARSAGNVTREKVEDMESQFVSLARRDREATVAFSTAVVAVAAGAGIEELFRSLGAAQVVRGGQTMNPSAGDIRTAIEATGARDVIVLPNNKNVILAARQAAGACVRVVETRSVPQGVAAMVALNPEVPAEENAAAMQGAAEQLRTAEVTRAARSTHIAGLDVRKDQPIGLVDGELVVAEETIAAAVRSCVARVLEGREASLITLYYGEDEDAASAEAVAGELRDVFGLDVELVDGGQPYYPYLIGVE